MKEVQHHNNLTAAKQLLREQMLEQRRNLSLSERHLLESRVCERLIQLIEEKNIRVVHTFLPMGNEFNHIPVIEYCLRKKIRVVTTKTLKRPRLQHLILSSLSELENGVFGTKYPKNAKEWTGSYNLIVVPGLAFDANGNRLGYGGGYYDAFLADHANCLKVAVAFPFQIISHVPVDDNDERVDLVYC